MVVPKALDLHLCFDFFQRFGQSLQVKGTHPILLDFVLPDRVHT
jgi:hypothetical protein